MKRPLKLVTIETEHGGIYRRGLTLQRAAREMFVRPDHLKHMLDTHGTCVVEQPTPLKAVWETRP